MLQPIVSVRAFSAPVAATAVGVPEAAPGLPEDSASLGGGQPPPVTAPQSFPAHLQAQALTAVLFPGLATLTESRPTAEQGLAHLARQGWRFYDDKAEVGLLGVQGEDFVDARRGEARLNLDRDDLERLAGAYAANPGLEKLEREGYRFYDAWRREVPGGARGACRIGTSGETSIPVKSFDEGVVRQTLGEWSRLQREHDQPAVGLYLGVPGKSLEEQLAVMTPEQAAEAAVRLAGAHELQVIDRRPAVMALAAKVPSAAAALSVQEHLGDHQAIRLVGEAITHPEEPLAALAQRLLKPYEYKKEFCEALVEEPYRDLLGKMTHNVSRYGVMQAQFEGATTPSQIWHKVDLAINQNFDKALTGELDTIAREMIALVPGEAARLAEQVSRGMERPHRALRGVLWSDEALKPADYFRIASNAPDGNLEPLWQRLSQEPGLAGRVETIRGISSQIDDPKLRDAAIRSLCSNEDVAFAGFKMLDHLGDLEPVTDAGVRAALLFVPPERAELARELVASTKDTYTARKGVEAVLLQTTPLEAARKFTESGYVNDLEVMRPFLARIEGQPELLAMVPRLTSSDPRLQGALLTHAFAHPTAGAEELLSRSVEVAKRASRETFEPEFVRVARSFSTPMLDWLGTVPEAGYPAYSALLVSSGDTLTRGSKAVAGLPDEARTSAALSLLGRREGYPAEAMPAFDRLAARLSEGEVAPSEVPDELAKLSQWAADTSNVVQFAAAPTQSGVIERDGAVMVGGMRLLKRRA